MATAMKSEHSKDARPNRRGNAQRTQNALLLWLDSNIDETNSDCRNTLTQLRRAVNTIYTFTDANDCFRFIEELTDNKACVITSGSLGQHVVPYIHHMSQVNSIFIFCENIKCHEQWASEWSKIKGVFKDITLICNALKQAAQQCEQNAISISFMPTNGDPSKRSLDQLDPSYMYTMILKEILLTIDFEPKHIQEFIEYCQDLFSENPFELNNIDKLKKQYHNKTPIWWYTYECFLYPMLNCSLRLLNMDSIINMGFFIKDLHLHIERLHKEQFNEQYAHNTFTVYRGQGLSKADFEEMKKTQDGLLSFNCFLSTSKDREVSLDFAHRALADPDMIGILFVMTINLSKSSAPFASITDVSYYKDAEDEILFSMNSVFRIGEIKILNQNDRLIQVQLCVTDDNDKDLYELTNCIREEIFLSDKGWPRIGRLLDKMGQFQKSLKIYEALLEETNNEIEKATLYELFGMAKREQGNNKEALLVFQQALEIRQRYLPENSFLLGYSFNNIGSAHHKMHNNSDALLNYKKALEIWQQSLAPNHSHLADCHYNIGALYYDIENHSEALLSYDKALEIYQKSLPTNHPYFAHLYGAIAITHHQICDYSKALSYHEMALDIQRKSLPPTHPDLAISFNNIGSTYENINEYSKAHSYYERAVSIAQKSLSEDNSSVQLYKKNLDRIKTKI